MVLNQKNWLPKNVSYLTLAWHFHVADTDKGFHTVPVDVECHLF
jgi:hypothetical protein